MKQATQKKQRNPSELETRGRKRNPRGPILPNGLFKEQWARIQKDASAQGIDSAVLQRRIVDWYYDALEKQDGSFSQEVEFEKLEKAKS